MQKTKQKQRSRRKKTLLYTDDTVAAIKHAESRLISATHTGRNDFIVWANTAI